MPKKLSIDPNRLKSRTPGDRRGTVVHNSKRDILPRKAKHKKKVCLEPSEEIAKNN